MNPASVRASTIETLKHPIVAMLARRRAASGDGVITNA
jgi:hypothetical protein